MTEATDNLILEILRNIQARLTTIEGDVREIKSRLTRVEGAIAALRRDIADDAEAIAQTNARMDRFEDRLSRIERRLELSDNGD